MIHYRLSGTLRVRREFWLQLVVYLVGLHGLFVLATSLLDQLRPHTMAAIADIDIDIPLLIGLGIIYLSMLLRRRKRTAWVAALGVYMFMLGFYAGQIQSAVRSHDISVLATKLSLPIVIIGLLVLYRKSFTVKSDIQSFGYALRFSAILLCAAFIYGTAGFMLMDNHDFHKEISINSAMHHTIDQFGLTTNEELTPHTKRARVFVDSLSVVSIAAVGYAVISLFQPIRSRVVGSHDNRQVAEKLLGDYPGKSEDFFKLWPQDKQYEFDDSGRSGLAYKVSRGMALVAGDPFGDISAADKLLAKFEDRCFGNDWSPVFVHTEPDYSEFYNRHGYTLQQIGEEAVLDLDHFDVDVRSGKYFRQINNRFKREGFRAEALAPPHSKAVVGRLKEISDDWLGHPGHAERGFMMGYFSEAYLQKCTIVVARDAAGTIQAFLNQIPSFDPEEANFDMLRSSAGSPGNINDFLLMAFIDHLRSRGLKRLNLGLCPLSGLDDMEERSLISRALHFVYSNGDRFYSFSGLKRFKAKYEPDWSDRYVAYKGGVRNFARSMNALNRAMHVKLPKK